MVDLSAAVASSIAHANSQSLREGVKSHNPHHLFSPHLLSSSSSSSSPSWLSWRPFLATDPWRSHARPPLLSGQEERESGSARGRGGGGGVAEEEVEEKHERRK
eukprot:301431-Hanusia_phi.AAC.1